MQKIAAYNTGDTEWPQARPRRIAIDSTYRLQRKFEFAGHFPIARYDRLPDIG
jgi:hypothetical protein